MEGVMIGRLAKVFPYLLLAPAVLPLVYVSGLVFPYIAAKIFLLWTLGIVALAVFAFLALSGQSFFYRRLRNRSSWTPAALLAVAYTTSFFGIDFYHSFWGLLERGDGLLTLTIITIFFYLILFSADRAFFERLMKVVTVVAGLVAGLAVLQWITTVSGGKAWFLPPVSGRIGSTLGNAAFLAAYLGMAFFISLVAYTHAIGVWRQVYKVSAILSILAILFTATRGTILAFLVVGIGTLIYIVWTGKERIRQYGQYGLVAIILLMAVFFGFRSQLAHSSFEPVRRIASISFADNTVASRLFVWKHIGAEALQRPVQGYGAEHIAPLFNKVYDPSKIVEQWFDRSHNAFLDYFVQYGAFGLVLYLALITFFGAYALRLHAREPSGPLNSGFLFLLLILTYAIQNFFVFDTPHSFWLLYAFLAVLIVQSDESGATALTAARIPQIVPSLISGGILLAIVPTVVLPFYADILLTQGYLLHMVDVRRANAYFERGLALNTFADLEYGYQAYDMYTAHQAPTLVGEDRIAAYHYALAVLSANFKKYPYDARTATYLGHVIDTAPPEITVDDTFEQSILSRAIDLSPLRSQAWYMMANISLRKADAQPIDSVGRKGGYQVAIRVLETYVKRETSLAAPRYILATLYYALGDAASAKKRADEALSLYLLPDVTAAKPAVKYYLAIKDWQHAARFLADMAEKNPSNHNILYDLAKVSYLAGDFAAAENIVVKLRAIDPAILGTDQNFLTAITAYEQSKK